MFEPVQQVGDAFSLGRSEDIHADGILEPLAEAPARLHQLTPFGGSTTSALRTGDERGRLLSEGRERTTTLGLKACHQLFPRRGIGRFGNEHDRLTTARDDVLFDPGEVFARLGRIGQRVGGVLEAHGADALEAPPGLHARAATSGRQQVEQQQPPGNIHTLLT